MLSAKKIAAGKTGQIEVRIVTKDLPGGPLNKLISISTNDSRNAIVTLSIKAVIESEIEMSASTVYFDNVPAGKEDRREVILTVLAAKPIRILSAASTDPKVSVRLEPVSGYNDKKFRLVVVRKANIKPGYHFGQITVKTSSRLLPEFTIFERGTATAH